ncbi:hypothetical protein VSDG_03155 [Cytospora chrysosperma]|uniref:Uncharacterized protein n=1 Tax=Cytospora chrysosperma TaxID=252740 RepID=A0A423W8S8_CYTCH|nr:hypothetical protein VSDG_03155 [Valsa sordida]
MIKGPFDSSAEPVGKMTKWLLFFKRYLLQSTVFIERFSHLFNIFEWDVMWDFLLLICLPASSGQDLQTSRM